MSRIGNTPIGGASTVGVTDTTKVSKTGDTMSGALLLHTSSPSNSLEAASKGYVDGLVTGVASAVHSTPVACVATSNLDLTGEETIDGVTTSSSRVLVTGQSTPAQNGIYVSGASTWSRASDGDTAAEVTKGQAVFVSSGGTLYGNSLWVSTATVTTLGTDTCSWAQIQGPSTAAVMTNAVSSATSLTISTNVVRFTSTSNVTATLPSAASWAGRLLIIQKTGASGVVTVNRAGSDTIAGQTSWTLDAPYDTLMLFAFTGSTDWMVF